jgi:hypothetical protein
VRGFELQSMIPSVSIRDGDEKRQVLEVGGGRNAIVEVESGAGKNKWGQGPFTCQHW